jgi:hypothetical protein
LLAIKASRHSWRFNPVTFQTWPADGSFCHFKPGLPTEVSVSRKLLSRTA